MNAKAFLNQAKKLNRMIENKRSEREQWLMLATSTTAGAASDTGVKVQSSGSKQQMANAVDHSIDIGMEIERAISRLFEARQQIVGVIEQLNAEEYDLLHKMYIGKTVVDAKTGVRRTVYMTLQEVADENGKSYSWARGVKGTGLARVQKIIDARRIEPVDEQMKRWHCEKV